jgi:hypothetical protein
LTILILQINLFAQANNNTGDIGMFAQIATFEETPEQLTEGLRHLREEVIPSVGTPDGLLAAYWLIDEPSGKRLTVMLWENDAKQAGAMPGIMQGVNERRAAAGRTNPPNSPISVQRYEIVGHTSGSRPGQQTAAVS